MKLFRKNNICILLVIGLTACNSPFTAKRTGYFEITFPKRAYQTFDEPGYPYTFQYPVYAKVVKDSSLFQSYNPYWINVDFPTFNGKIYISYKRIGGSSVFKVKGPDGKYHDSVAVNKFINMVTDAYNLSYKNDVKAYSIEDSIIHTPNSITGIYFNLTGEVATAHQFFLSDSTKNFLRGALYFDATPNEDSLRPVNNFLQQDMKHLINTLKWK